MLIKNYREFLNENLSTQLSFGLELEGFFLDNASLNFNDLIYDKVIDSSIKDNDGIVDSYFITDEVITKPLFLNISNLTKFKDLILKLHEELFFITNESCGLHVSYVFNYDDKIQIINNIGLSKNKNKILNQINTKQIFYAFVLIGVLYNIKFKSKYKDLLGFNRMKFYKDSQASDSILNNIKDEDIKKEDIEDLIYDFILSSKGVYKNKKYLLSFSGDRIEWRGLRGIFNNEFKKLKEIIKHEYRQNKISFLDLKQLFKSKTIYGLTGGSKNKTIKKINRYMKVIHLMGLCITEVIREGINGYKLNDFLNNN